MSVILQPQVSFPLVRQIANHLDATTYYVQAVVRDANGTIIDTVNLASQGDQRYQTSWQVPADTSGQGRYISVVTSVYTDANYTTKSSDYGDEETTYLIFDRVMPAMRGGGSGVDARTVRRIIKEELENIPKPEKVKIPKQQMPEMRWDDVLAEVQDLKEALSKVPTTETDITPIEERLGEVLQKIEDKEVTPGTDLTPLIEALTEYQENADVNHQDLRSLLEAFEEKLMQEIPRLIDEAIGKVNFVSNFTTQAQPREMREEKPAQSKAPLFDITKLAR